jgi:hypothetical protein
MTEKSLSGIEIHDWSLIDDNREEQRERNQRAGSVKR